MPALEYFLVAESCSVDASRTSLSIFHILNDVRVPEIPGLIHEIVIISGWISAEDEIRNRHETQLRVEISVPGAPRPQEFRGNMVSEVRFHYFNFQIAGVPVLEPGDIIVQLFQDDQPRATHTMEVSTGE